MDPNPTTIIQSKMDILILPIRIKTELNQRVWNFIGISKVTYAQLHPKDFDELQYFETTIRPL
jgi:hypothetical protein